jgi:hypothetical protein
LKYINRPVLLERALYEEATQWLVAKISVIPGVKSFYRFGNITIPGISDLDLLIVFENDEECFFTGFEGMPDKYQPLFTHGIMAVSEDHFFKNLHFTLWSDHVLLYGIDLESQKKDIKTTDELAALKIQTAIEFLVANYIDLKIQLTYRTINIRSFLQHMKGIIYDLEYLNITSGPVLNLLMELRHVAQNWFVQTPSIKALDIWVNNFDKVYETFCDEIFRKYPMYLPEMNRYQISRNARIEPAERLSFVHQGLVLPSVFSIFGKKMIRLQNRFNNFHFGLPITTFAPSPIISQRFEFLKEMKTYNRKYLPGFMTLTTSITSKII